MPGFDSPRCSCCQHFKRLKPISNAEGCSRYYGGCSLHNCVFNLYKDKFSICINWQFNLDILIRNNSKGPFIESDKYLMDRFFPNLEDGMLYSYLEFYVDVPKSYIFKPELLTRFTDLPEWDRGTYVET